MNIQKTMERSTMLLMGKSSISMAIFNSFLYVYQRILRFSHGFSRKNEGLWPRETHCNQQSAVRWPGDATNATTVDTSGVFKYLAMVKIQYPPVN